MPNIPANRVNAQLDLMGPSHTVSAEERSGLVALDLAIRALRAGDVDAAIVGAVDLSHEPVHNAALGTVAGARTPADAAVTLVLRRLADVADETVLAVLSDADTMSEGPVASDVLGHAHAASGLVNLAAAIVSHCEGPVSTTDLSGRTHTIAVAAPSTGWPATPSFDGPVPEPVLTRPAHAPEVVMPAVHTADPFAHLARISSLDGTSVMAAAPTLTRITDTPVGGEDDAAPVHRAPPATRTTPKSQRTGRAMLPADMGDEPGRPARSGRAVFPADMGDEPSRPARTSTPASPLASLLDTLHDAHAQFVATQTASHTAFLHAQDAMMAALTGGAAASTASPPMPAAPLPVSSPRVETPAPSPDPSPSVEARSPRVETHTPSPSPEPRVPRVARTPPIGHLFPKR